MTADHTTMATVLQDGDRIGLRYHRRLAHSPGKVWRALTESEHLRHWLPCDIVGERRSGADIELPFWPDHMTTYRIDEPVLAGRINVWEPPDVFEWTWGGDVLRFELAPAGTGTSLTFTTWFADPDREAAANAAGGYHVCLDHLSRLLDGETGLALTDPEVQATADGWQRKYDAVLAEQP
jgi:uncharacterized protein YndB with AHSA1/START domain